VLKFVAGGALAITAAAVGVHLYRRSRITPAERERRRRAMLTAKGKLADATLLEAHDGLLLYSYEVRGVAYTCSQDVGMLRDRLPDAPFGPVLVKYDPKNPANSIVLSEEWSGFPTYRGE
jgi:hypothetical protein